VLGRPHGLESDEGDLHTCERADRIERRVGDIQTLGEAAHEHEHECMERDHVGDEHVSTPGSDHVKVEEGGKSAKEHGAITHSTHPQVERKEEEENRDGLVVV